MNDVAVTRIEDQNFQILSCHQVNGPQSKTLLVDENAIDKLLKPIQRKYEDSVIKSAKLQIKDFLIQIFKKPDQITLFDIENMTEYKIGVHKARELVFAFLLRPLSDLELNKIEKESTGKTYFTGDSADFMTTEEDFKH
ncbi:MAG: hypothetical protein OXM55_01845 [Bdellovibrionales bacterium]|nr:hypothetical protein [Bdellovibrionales bacterium]